MRHRRRRSERATVASRSRLHEALVGALFLACGHAAGATPQVVGDEACQRYEVDMASFASCEDGKVVRPAPDVPTVLVADRDGAEHLARRFQVPYRLRAVLTLAGMMVETSNHRAGADDAARYVNCGAVQGPSMFVVIVQTE